MAELEQKISSANDKISTGDTNPQLILQLSEDSAQLQSLEAEWITLQEELEKTE